jgi:hypothetical protein
MRKLNSIRGGGGGAIDLEKIILDSFCELYNSERYFKDFIKKSETKNILHTTSEMCNNDSWFLSTQIKNLHICNK